MSNLFQLLINREYQPQDLALVDESGNKLPMDQQLPGYREPKQTVGEKINEGLFGKIVDNNNNSYVNDTVLDYQNYLRDNGYDEKTVRGVAQGLNSGKQKIADWINQYNTSKIGQAQPINLPGSPEEIELAKIGQFNSYPARGNANYPNRQGGILNDFAAGFKDNFQNDFQVNNLMPDANKSFAHRFGEGLGTAVRFLNGPIGRGLIAGGLVAATGGNPLQTVAYGGQAAALNQQNVMKNKLYRDSLSREGIDTSKIGGYIGDEAYASLMKAKQLEEQQLYRQMVLQNQLQQNQLMNDFRNSQLSYQKAKDEESRILKQQELNQNNYWKQRDLDYKYDALDKKADDNKKKNNNSDLAEIELQLKNFEDMFDKVPNKFRGSTEGYLRRKLGFASDNEANFDAQRTLLFNQIARKLGGEKGVLSDQDIKRIEKALPTLSDSYPQRKAKMKAVYDLLNIKKGSYQQQFSDPLGIR